MRNLFLLIVFALFTSFASAQVTKSVTLRPDVWYYDVTTDYSLSTTSGDSTLTYTIQLNKPTDVFYDVQVELDSVSGTPDYDIDLKGKVFENDPWTDLETDVTWDGTSSDTTVLFQEHSTSVFYRYLQLQVNGQAGTGAANVDRISFWVVIP